MEGKNIELCAKFQSGNCNLSKCTCGVNIFATCGKLLVEIYRNGCFHRLDACVKGNLNWLAQNAPLWVTKALKALNKELESHIPIKNTSAVICGPLAKRIELFVQLLLPKGIVIVVGFTTYLRGLQKSRMGCGFVFKDNYNKWIRWWKYLWQIINLIWYNWLHQFI